MEGVKVLILEAGRSFDPASEVAMFQLPSQAPLRGVSTPDKQYGFHDCSIHSGWDIPGEPYTNANPEPENQFRWWRQRMMGERTNHWGRISLRNGPYDFMNVSPETGGPVTRACSGKIYRASEKRICCVASKMWKEPLHLRCR